MFNQNFKTLFLRDLNTLKTEIKAYPDTNTLWQIVPGISNSGGTLALHLCGNLQHFFGAVLGNTGYVRQREAEFNTRNLEADDLIKRIEQSEQDVAHVFDSLKADELEKPYPINVFGEEMTVEYFIIHLYGHLSYHLGQVNYHRRITSA